MDIRRSIKYRLAPRLPFSAYKYLYRKEVVGLFYHVVTDKPLPYVQHLYDYKSEAQFEQDLIYLKENYNLISYDQLAAGLSGGKLKPGSIMISFDDGYKECFSIVRPIMLKLDIPCTFFITSDFIDNQKMFYRNKVSWCIDVVNSLEEPEWAQFLVDVRNTFGKTFQDKEAFNQWIKELPQTDEALIDNIAEKLNMKWGDLIKEYRPFMSTDEIKELASDGFEIGAHSCRHIIFNKLNATQIEEEIVVSSQKVKEITGQQIVPFSFPFSGHGIDWQIISSLREKEDYLGLFFDSRGIVESQPYVINRIWADILDGSKDSGSNLVFLLQEAYKEHFLSR